MIRFLVRANAFVLACALATSACSYWKPVTRTAADAAHILCELWASEQPREQLGLSPADFCAVERNLRPFIDAALSAKQSAGMAVGSRQP